MENSSRPMNNGTILRCSDPRWKPEECLGMIILMGLLALMPGGKDRSARMKLAFSYFLMTITAMIRILWLGLTPIHASVAVTYISHMPMDPLLKVKGLWWSLGTVLYIVDSVMTIIVEHFPRMRLMLRLGGLVGYVVILSLLAVLLAIRLTGRRRRAALNLVFQWTMLLAWGTYRIFMVLSMEPLLWLYVGYLLGTCAKINPFKGPSTNRVESPGGIQA